MREDGRTGVSHMAEVRRAVELTSVRSLSHIVRTETRIARLIWTLTILSCASLAVYQLYNIIYYYIGFPSNVRVKQTIDNPHFPDVTVCRINAYNNGWSGQFSYEQYYHLIEDLHRSGRLDRISATITNESAEYLIKYLKSPNGYYANVKRSEDELNVMGNTLIKTCFYSLWTTDENTGSSIDCISTVNLSFVPLFGKCATFHLPINYTRQVRGLVATLYLEDLSENIQHFYDEFYMLPVDATGLRVIVHPRGTEPDQDLGIDVPPGSEASIDIDETLRIRLPAPYGNCVDCKYLTDNCRTQEGALLYTMNSCYNLCYQKNVIKRCQCVENSAAFTVVELNAVNYSICGDLNFTKQTKQSESCKDYNSTTWTPDFRPHANLDCMQNTTNVSLNSLMLDITDEGIASGLMKLKCAEDAHSSTFTTARTCPVPCNEIQYSLVTSNTRWPHPSYELAFYKSSIRNNSIYGDRFAAYETLLQANEAGLINDSEALKQVDQINLIRKNFLRLKVQFSRRGLHVLEDTVSITWDSLLSSVGGTLSLWLDVTAITLVELVELLYSVVVVQLGYKSNHQVNNNNNQITSRL